MEAQKQKQSGSGDGKSQSQRGATVTEAQSSQHQQQYTYQFQYQYPPQQQQQQQQYGTFQPQPAMGFPQPTPPPGSVAVVGTPTPPYAPAPPGYYPQGYQPVSGYAVVTEGRPMRLHRNSVPCCGIGIGWILFIAGFFFAAVPWYVGAFVFFCVGVDLKEKPGLLACTIAAFIAAVAILLGLTNSTARW